MGGVVGEISPPSLQQLTGEGLICCFQPLWSLTVHFINQIPFEEGLEGLAFPPSWAWDGFPAHFPDQQLQRVIPGDGQTPGLKPFWPWSLGIQLLGDVWECVRWTNVCPSLCCTLPAREGWILPWTDIEWNYLKQIKLIFSSFTSSLHLVDIWQILAAIRK